MKQAAKRKRLKRRIKSWEETQSRVRPDLRIAYRKPGSNKH